MRLTYWSQVRLRQTIMVQMDGQIKLINRLLYKKVKISRNLEVLEHATYTHVHYILW